MAFMACISVPAILAISTSMSKTAPSRPRALLPTAFFGRHEGTGDISIKAEGSSITTSGINANGISGSHRGTGDIDILVKDSTLKTSGVSPLSGGSRAIFGEHQGSGNLDIDVQDSTIMASGLGIQAHKRGTGNVNIKVKGSAITSGAGAIYGRFSGGDGDISIVVRDSTVTASGRQGILGQHDGTGGINIQVHGGLINAPGLNAHGIQVQIASATGFDAEGYRRQSVTVDGTVRGGSDLGTGVRLAGGGRVVVGPNGHIGATSGIAIWSTGTGPLHLDFRPDGRTMWEVVSGSLVSDDPITLVVNGVVLIDGAAGSTGGWAPNGAWEVRGRMVRVGSYITANTTEVYAPRAALYESLPGLLLRLDAGAPVRRPEEPVWAQLEYGTGSGDPKRSQVGASYDFDRMDAMAGVSRDWGNGFGGSAWLRRVHGEVKADMPAGPGEMELHGVGAGVAAHWRRGDGLEVSGELSLTDFDVDADSSWRGHLAEDAGADLWQARLAAEYRLKQAEGLALLPRVWVWHAKAEVDDFTDAVGARVSADESRTAVGLGLRAEMEQSESLLYGSLDVEQLVEGEETVTAVSQGRLASESERTRVLVGAGGLWQGQRVTLQGGLRMADPGGKNQEVSASFSISGSF